MLACTMNHVAFAKRLARAGMGALREGGETTSRITLGSCSHCGFNERPYVASIADVCLGRTLPSPTPDKHP